MEQDEAQHRPLPSSGPGEELHVEGEGHGDGRGSATMKQVEKGTTMLPTSPNWYCGQVSDCSPAGGAHFLYAYGAKADVQLLDLMSRRFVGTLRGHEDRVSAVEFIHRSSSSSSSSTQNLLCASGAADATVRLWDALSRQCLAVHRLHKAQVTSLSASPVGADVVVVSGDKGGNIVVWRFAGGIVSGEGHSRCFSAKEKWGIDAAINCLKCSPYQADEVAIGFQNGVVVIADVREGTIMHRLSGHVEEIHGLSWLPMQFAKQKEGPKSDSWRSEKNEVPESSDEMEQAQSSESTADVSWRINPLLASSSRDQTIRIWNTQTGKFFCMLRLPAARRSARDKTGVWLSIAWSLCKKNQLITASNDDELLLWDINDRKKPTPTRFTGAGHNRSIFGINFIPDDPRHLVTHSMDRQIVMWNCVKLKSVWSIPTLGGFVYSLDYSEMDPTKLAVGLGDKSIRLWDISEATSREGETDDEDQPAGSATNKNPYRTVLLWKGLQAKVSCVAWHPASIGILAYGMDDGRVGVYNTHAQTVVQFTGNHSRGPVYELGWNEAASLHAGKQDEDIHSEQSEQSDKQEQQAVGKKRYLLYSCGGDGNILEFDPARPNNSPVNINTLIGSSIEDKTKLSFPKRSDFAWKKDGTLLAIGNSNGTVELYQYPSWRCIRIFSDHRKLINRLKWNYSPDDGTGPSYWSNLLASASDDNTVNVYDVTSIISRASSGEISVTTLSPLMGTSEECIRTLKGHTRSVTDISWCPHNPELIASASMDGSVQVWNALTGAALSNYRGHEGRVFAVRWNALDSRFLFSGSEDQTVRMWEYMAQPHTVPPVLEPLMRKKKSTAKKSNAKETTKPQPSETEAVVPAAADQLLSDAQSSTPVLPPAERTEQPASLPEEQTSINSSQPPLASIDQPPPSDIITDLGAKDTAKRGKKKVKKERTMLPLSNSALQQRSQMIDVCKEIAHELFKDRKQGGSSKADEDSYEQRQAPALQISAEGSASEPAKSAVLPEVKLFLGETAARDLLREEGAAHNESGSWENSAILAMWQGDVAAALGQVMQKDGLSTMWLALSPMAGREIWEAMCAAYAFQLKQAGDAHKAVLFFLTCQRVVDAIKVYSEAEMFREAILLAKMRLMSNDPLLRELYVQWAEWSEQRTMFEQAAKCYLAIEETDKAIQLLARKGDAPALDSGKSDAALTIAASYVKLCLYSTHDFDKAFELSTSFPSLYANLYLVCTEQILWEDEHKREEDQPTSALPSFLHVLFPAASEFLKRLRETEAEQHILEKVYLAWQGRGLPLDKVSLLARRDEIKSEYIDNQRRRQKVPHSIYLTLALMSILLTDFDDGMRYCLISVASTKDTLLQLRLFSLCFPSWRIIKSAFGSADVNEQAEKSAAVSMPADIQLSVWTFGACWDVVDRLLTASTATIDSLFSPPSEEIKPSEALTKRNRRPLQLESPEEQRQSIAELADVVCDERLFNWHRLRDRRRELRKRIVWLEAANRAKQTAKSATSGSSSASAGQRTAEEVEEEQLKAELVRVQESMKEIVQKGEDNAHGPDKDAFYAHLPALPPWECGPTLAFALCCELGFLPLARSISERMERHTQPPSAMSAPESTANEWSEKWMRVKDRYSRMLASRQ